MSWLGGISLRESHGYDGPKHQHPAAHVRAPWPQSERNDVRVGFNNKYELVMTDTRKGAGKTKACVTRVAVICMKARGAPPRLN